MALDKIPNMENSKLDKLNMSSRNIQAVTPLFGVNPQDGKAMKFPTSRAPFKPDSKESSEEKLPKFGLTSPNFELHSSPDFDQNPEEQPNVETDLQQMFENQLVQFVHDKVTVARRESVISKMTGGGGSMLIQSMQNLMHTPQGYTPDHSPGGHTPSGYTPGGHTPSHNPGHRRIQSNVSTTGAKQ